MTLDSSTKTADKLKKTILMLLGHFLIILLLVLAFIVSDNMQFVLLLSILLPWFYQILGMPCKQDRWRSPMLWLLYCSIFWFFFRIFENLLSPFMSGWILYGISLLLAVGIFFLTKKAYGKLGWNFSKKESWMIQLLLLMILISCSLCFDPYGVSSRTANNELYDCFIIFLTISLFFIFEFYREITWIRYYERSAESKILLHLRKELSCAFQNQQEFHKIYNSLLCFYESEKTFVSFEGRVALERIINDFQKIQKGIQTELPLLQTTIDYAKSKGLTITIINPIPLDCFSHEIETFLSIVLLVTLDSSAGDLKNQQMIIQLKKTNSNFFILFQGIQLSTSQQHLLHRMIQTKGSCKFISPERIEITLSNNSCHLNQD